MKINSYKTELNESGGLCLVAEKSFDIDGRKVFTNSQMVADFIGEQIGLRKAAEEYVYILCLDGAGHIVGLFEASHGSANNSMMPVREICKKALMLNAVNIIATHNHPSGEVEASNADLQSTHKLKEAMKIIGISLLDHIIVGGNTTDFYSFAQNGIL